MRRRLLLPLLLTACHTAGPAPGGAPAEADAAPGTDVPVVVVAPHAVPDGVEIRDNLVHDAREPGTEWPTHPQLGREALLREAAPLLAGSSFLRSFGR